MIEAVHERVRAVITGLGQPEWAGFSEHGERLQRLVANVPPALWHKVSSEVATHYRKLEDRYGRATAIAILSAGIAGTAIPIPGTTILAAAPLVALAELHHRLVERQPVSSAGGRAEIRLADSELVRLGKQWLRDLADVFKQG
jgi:hypothetical protein